jgi:hypothetical protein
MMRLFLALEPSFRWGIVLCKCQRVIFSRTLQSHAVLIRNMKDFGSIPFAARGTVIGCDSENLEFVDVLFDEPFPSGTNLGGRCSIMRGASVPVKHLLNVTTVCAPAISNSSVKLEKPVSMSASHFAAAHDSVVLATDVPVVTKGSQGILISKPPVQEKSKPPVQDKSKPPVQEKSKPVASSSSSSSSSSSTRVVSIAPRAPPLSVTANIPLVNSESSRSNQAAVTVPSSDLLAIMNSSKKKSAVANPGTVATVEAASSESTVNSSKCMSGVEFVDSLKLAPDLLAVRTSGAQPPSSNSAVASKSAYSAPVATTQDRSALSGGNTLVGPAHSSSQFSPFPPPLPSPYPLNYGVMMGMHPMFMGMMPPMLPQPPSTASDPVAPSASRPDASSKVDDRAYFFFFNHIFIAGIG